MFFKMNDINLAIFKVRELSNFRRNPVTPLPQLKSIKVSHKNSFDFLAGHNGDTSPWVVTVTVKSSFLSMSPSPSPPKKKYIQTAKQKNNHHHRNHSVIFLTVTVTVKYSFYYLLLLNKNPRFNNTPPF